MSEMCEPPASATFLQRAFSTEQESLLSNLRSSARIVHAGDRGEVNERHFIELLRHYLPNRYTVEKASVLDCNGEVSDSIDVVVFDRQYTPTLLDSDKHRYVPAEAVYAIFECKPTINKKYLEYAAEKAASVRKLKRTTVEICHAGGVYPPKPLIEIIAGILSIEVEWKDSFGEKFRSIHRSLQDDKAINCGFAAIGASFDVFSNGDDYTYGPSNNALAFFVFRFLWKLQSVGTVPAVDWITYANRLSQPQEGQ
jgi:hypothetical protein